MSKKLPDTLVIIAAVLAFFTLLTWIIPAGEFDRVDIDGRSVVVANSYHSVKQNPQSIADLLKAPVKGFEDSAIIIAFVLFVGGVFGVINRTGSIESSLKSLIAITSKQPKFQRLIIPFLIVIFAITGATFGMSEEVLVFILITIPLCISLGYDSIVGVAVALAGTAVGFGGAITNPFTIGIAQGIADLPIFSGWEYRLFVLVVLTTITILYIDRYAQKILKTKTLSPVFQIDSERVDINHGGDTSNFTLRRKLIISNFIITIVLLVMGATLWEWYIFEISGLFLGCAIVTSVLFGLNSNQLIEAFLSGAKEMLPAGLVIAFSKGIIILATEGKIIDAILFSVAGALQGFPTIVSAEIMLVVQCLINFVVPSGSGQAALTIPIMAPLSDVLGFTRQTAVLIFQLGDGLNNMIIPTSGVTMGTLAIAKIPYNVWVKWLLPLMIILILTAMLLIIPPVMVFYWGPR